MPDALCSSTGSLQALTGGPKVFKPFMPGVATQGYQMADVPAARYRAGLNALADYIKSTFAGKSFRSTADKNAGLAMRVSYPGSLANWTNA
jgi:hypothetical protein